MKGIRLLENYSPAADIVVTAICFVMIVLIVFSYVTRTKSTKYFLSMVGLALGAAWSDIGFYILAITPGYEILASWLRCFYHAMLFLIFVHYIAYICEVTRYEKTKTYVFLANIIFAAVLVADIIITAQGPTFYYTGTAVEFVRHGIYIVGYLALLLICLILMAKVRDLLYSRVMSGFYGTIVVSFLLLLIQGISNQSSFTVASLMLPMIAILYVLHSNPYDAMLGTNDLEAMQDLVKYYWSKKKDFVFMSLYLREFDEEDTDMPDEIKAQFRRFMQLYFKTGKLFKISRGHAVVLFPKKRDGKCEERVQRILDAFYPLYDHYRYDYKIVVGEAVDEISEKNDYASYIRSIQRPMPECTVHKASPEDVTAYRKSEYILKELADIYRWRDLNDPRVLVYCQPVLNVKTGKYDTAEALMRLGLAETGIVYPNEFIPLAENQGYIHVMTKIILHKTCEAIRKLMEAGHDIQRISVNVSVQELKEEGFCSDIMDIIEESGISGGRIAIELTESRNENDFMMTKEKIEELKGNGLQLYLDDFGTGYSNMERIMELPFDIIKFDRSMVLAAGADERSKKMVSNLANMFSNMGYYVLYEGVEKDSDEDLCKGMSASYLQGFKYARPVPITDLIEYVGVKAG
ncbi:MAG: EAL domain-containing protein [Lachnospiraceae bacterium]|nr:EAL domain-containing protein [Lachnospiraceae bacterium]